MLNLQNIDVSYRDAKILENISFEIKEGEFIGIIGPNGAGKTTLLKTITRILNPNKGDVFLDGRNMKELKRKEIARIMAVVPQNTAVTTMFTVHDVVMMGRYPHLKNRFSAFDSLEDLNIVENAMKLCDVNDFSEKYVNEISGGERQMVVVARALAQEPKILLLDEPTSNLDMKHQLRILNLVKNLQANKGITVLMVIHDLNLAARFCDRLILLHNHKILCDGRPEEVLSKENLRKAYEVDVDVVYNEKTMSLYIMPTDITTDITATNKMDNGNDGHE